MEGHGQPWEGDAGATPDGSRRRFAHKRQWAFWLALASLSGFALGHRLYRELYAVWVHPEYWPWVAGAIVVSPLAFALGRARLLVYACVPVALIALLGSDSSFTLRLAVLGPRVFLVVAFWFAGLEALRGASEARVPFRYLWLLAAAALGFEMIPWWMPDSHGALDWEALLEEQLKESARALVYFSGAVLGAGLLVRWVERASVPMTPGVIVPSFLLLLAAAGAALLRTSLVFSAAAIPPERRLALVPHLRVDQLPHHPSEAYVPLQCVHVALSEDSVHDDLTEGHDDPVCIWAESSAGDRGRDPGGSRDPEGARIRAPRLVDRTPGFPAGCDPDALRRRVSSASAPVSNA